MTAAELVAAIEKIADSLADVRERVEELDVGASYAGLHNGQALDAAAGGLTCVIATLTTAQRIIKENDRG